MPTDAPGTKGVLWFSEEGNGIGMRQTMRMHSSSRAMSLSQPEEMTSFTRSTDPCTSIVTTLRPARVGEGGAYESASRLGKLGQPRGTNTEVGANGRSAARRVSTLSQGRQLGT
jgi:hypothetical protein